MDSVHGDGVVSPGTPSRAAPTLEDLYGMLRAGQFESAEAEVRAALALEPNHLGFLDVLAIALTKQCQFDAALAIAWGLSTNLDCPINIKLSGTRISSICCTQLGVPQIARPLIDSFALSDSPYVVDRCWRPRLLMMIGEVEDAREALLEIQERFPGDLFALMFLGRAELTLGNPQGYVDSGAFSSRAFFEQYYPGSLCPEKIWEGQPLEGKSVIVIPHGGVGDYIQFLRYVPALRAAGAREVALAPPNNRCRGLVDSAGADRLCDLNPQEVEAADYWIPIYGLDRLREARQAPARAYLKAPLSAAAGLVIAEARSRAQGRRVVGISWHSDMDDGEQKSVPIHALLPLFALPNIQWVILQRGWGLRQFRQSGLDRDCVVADETLTFDETAAVMSGLDAVVSICSYTFHIAAALGVPTWMLAGRVLNERHLNRESQSVLYESARLARQPRIGDWPGAVARLMAEMSAGQWPADGRN